MHSYTETTNLHFQKHVFTSYKKSTISDGVPIKDVHFRLKMLKLRL